MQNIDPFFNLGQPVGEQDVFACFLGHTVLKRPRGGVSAAQQEE